MSEKKPTSPLRRRMIKDMSIRRFGEKTQHEYIRHIETFAKFLGRSPDTATAKDLRRYQVHQTETGVQPPTMNSSAVALRFLLTVTLGRANLAAQLTRVHYPRRLPRVLSSEEVSRLIDADVAGDQVSDANGCKDAPASQFPPDGASLERSACRRETPVPRQSMSRWVKTRTPLLGPSVRIREVRT